VLKLCCAASEPALHLTWQQGAPLVEAPVSSWQTKGAGLMRVLRVNAAGHAVMHLLNDH
jgi:hypothetical protein